MLVAGGVDSAEVAGMVVAAVISPAGTNLTNGIGVWAAAATARQAYRPQPAVLSVVDGRRGDGCRGDGEKWGLNMTGVVSSDYDPDSSGPCVLLAPRES